MKSGDKKLYFLCAERILLDMWGEGWSPNEYNIQ